MSIPPNSTGAPPQNVEVSLSNSRTQAEQERSFKRHQIWLQQLSQRYRSSSSNNSNTGGNDSMGGSSLASTISRRGNLDAALAAAMAARSNVDQRGIGGLGLGLGLGASSLSGAHPRDGNASRNFTTPIPPSSTIGSSNNNNNNNNNNQNNNSNWGAFLDPNHGWDDTVLVMNVPKKTDRGSKHLSAVNTGDRLIEMVSHPSSSTSSHVASSMDTRGIYSRPFVRGVDPHWEREDAEDHSSASGCVEMKTLQALNEGGVDASVYSFGITDGGDSVAAWRFSSNRFITDSSSRLVAVPTTEDGVGVEKDVEECTVLEAEGSNIEDVSTTGRIDEAALASEFYTYRRGSDGKDMNCLPRKLEDAVFPATCCPHCYCARCLTQVTYDLIERDTQSVSQPNEACNNSACNCSCYNCESLPNRPYLCGVSESEMRSFMSNLKQSYSPFSGPPTGGDAVGTSLVSQTHSHTLQRRGSYQGGSSSSSDGDGDDHVDELMEYSPTLPNESNARRTRDTFPSDNYTVDTLSGSQGTPSSHEHPRMPYYGRGEGRPQQRHQEQQPQYSATSKGSKTFAKSSPPARYGHALCEVEANAFVLFGGATTSRTYYNDIWLLTLREGVTGSFATPSCMETWRRLELCGDVPSGRYGHSMHLSCVQQLIRRASDKHVCNNDKDKTDLLRLIVFGGTDELNWFDDLYEVNLLVALKPGEMCDRSVLRESSELRWENEIVRTTDGSIPSSFGREATARVRSSWSPPAQRLRYATRLDAVSQPDSIIAAEFRRFDQTTDDLSLHSSIALDAAGRQSVPYALESIREDYESGFGDENDTTGAFEMNDGPAGNAQQLPRQQHQNERMRIQRESYGASPGSEFAAAASSGVYSGPLGGGRTPSPSTPQHQQQQILSSASFLRTLGDSPAGRRSHTLIPVAPMVSVLFGGYTRVSMNDVWLLDERSMRWYPLVTRGWDPKRPMMFVPSPRYCHSAVVTTAMQSSPPHRSQCLCTALKQKAADTERQAIMNACGSKELYVFGGFGLEGTSEPTLWCLSFDTCVWTAVEAVGEFPTARFGHSAVIVDGRMFLFGGMSDYPSGESMNDCYMYTFEINEWRMVDGERKHCCCSGTVEDLQTTTTQGRGIANVSTSPPVATTTTTTTTTTVAHTTQDSSVTAASSASHHNAAVPSLTVHSNEQQSPHHVRYTVPPPLSTASSPSTTLGANIIVHRPSLILAEAPVPCTTQLNVVCEESSTIGTASAGIQSRHAIPDSGARYAVDQIPSVGPLIPPAPLSIGNSPPPPPPSSSSPGPLAATPPASSSRISSETFSYLQFSLYGPENQAPQPPRPYVSSTTAPSTVLPTSTSPHLALSTTTTTTAATTTTTTGTIVHVPRPQEGGGNESVTMGEFDSRSEDSCSSFPSFPNRDSGTPDQLRVRSKTSAPIAFASTSSTTVELPPSTSIPSAPLSTSVTSGPQRRRIRFEVFNQNGTIVHLPITEEIGDAPLSGGGGSLGENVNGSDAVPSTPPVAPDVLSNYSASAHSSPQSTPLLYHYTAPENRPPSTNIFIENSMAESGVSEDVDQHSASVLLLPSSMAHPSTTEVSAPSSLGNRRETATNGHGGRRRFVQDAVERPSARHSHTAVLNTHTNQLIMHGGWNGEQCDDRCFRVSVTKPTLQDIVRTTFKRMVSRLSAPEKKRKDSTGEM